jgi:homocysteine S-methyltransferase
MLSCVSPENFEINLKELKNLNVPFGFKVNAFVTTKPKDGYTSTFTKSNGNPNEFLGQREDLTPQKVGELARNFHNNGATIIGGCCETRPSHIEAMANTI